MCIFVLYKRQNMFVPTYLCLLYAFLNRSSNFDEIGYRDRLDLGEEDGLNIFAKR